MDDSFDRVAVDKDRLVLVSVGHRQTKKTSESPRRDGKGQDRLGE